MAVWPAHGLRSTVHGEYLGSVLLPLASLAAGNVGPKKGAWCKGGIFSPVIILWCIWGRTLIKSIRAPSPLPFKSQVRLLRAHCYLHSNTHVTEGQVGGYVR